jgi:predicted phage tail protein
VVMGDTYVYQVKAVNLTGSSAYVTSAAIALLIPAAPSNAIVTVVRNGTTDRVTLTWTDNANNETGFRIQRATNAAFTTGLTTYIIAANATSYQQIVSRGMTYYYRIQAFNTILGASVWVNFSPFPLVTP